jgi:hypothetical protein
MNPGAPWKNDISSVLLYGPPGTSKSTIVKSLAARLGWPLIELTPSHFVIKGIEAIEEQARQIFEDLGVLRETVVLFDELDSLLIDRERIGPDSMLSFSVPAMLPKLQRLTKLAKRQRLLIVFATNFYDRLDPAMVRRGRIDEHLVVLPYNKASRLRLIQSAGVSGPIAASAAARTALCVYEDIKRYAEALKTDPAALPPTASIAPSLYSTRIPDSVAATTPFAHKRHIQRLAIEVAEVTSRLLEQPRMLHAAATPEETKAQLEKLKKTLSKAGEEEWADLCGTIIKNL